MNSKEDHIIKQITDFYKGEMCGERVEEFKEWLKEDEENQNVFLSYRRLYHNARAIKFLEQLNSEKAWSSISKKITKSKTRKLHLWIPYAATVAVLIFISVLLVFETKKGADFVKDQNFTQIAKAGSRKAVLTLANGSKVKLYEQLEQNISEVDGTLIRKDSANNLTYSSVVSGSTKLIFNNIEVPRGGEYSLILSDGTKVWLNSDSKLRYPVKFSPNKREVYLVGEAYFEVKHNAKAPFTVHTHDTQVKVLGTKFNISSYEEQDFITTTLVEGSVKVDNFLTSELLEPGFQSTIIRGKDGIDVNQVETRLYTSWVDGVFEFEDMDLEYIMAQLGRWYNVKFFFTEEKFKNIRFTGAIKRDKPFEFALDLIEKIADVDFAIKNEYIIIGAPK